jgi:hypothetical protein
MDNQEILKIYKLEDNDSIPKVMNSKLNIPRKMEQPKAIILHQIKMKDYDTIEEFIDNFIKENETYEKSYNFILTPKNEILCLLEPPFCSKAVNSYEYTRIATNMFGSELAPPWLHTKRTPHIGSPNTITINIAFNKESEDSKLDQVTLHNLIKLTSFVLNKYTKGLHAVSYESIDNKKPINKIYTTDIQKAFEEIESNRAMKYDKKTMDMINLAKSKGYKTLEELREKEKVDFDERTIKECNIMKVSDIVKTDITGNPCKNNPAFFCNDNVAWLKFLIEVDKLSEKWMNEYKKLDTENKYVIAGHPTLNINILKLK